MNKEVLIRPGINEVASGITATVKIIRPFDGVIAGRTARHEARHVVPNPRNTRLATNRPGPGSLGHTELYVFDSIQAAAPHALHDSGTSHDVRLIGYHGHDIGSAASAARSILAYLDEEVEAVARTIEANGEISGFEAEEIMKQVANPEAEVRVRNLLGEEENFVIRTRKVDGYFIPLILTENPHDQRN